ncbi:MAG TPA: DUF934 domain-containing protein [Burkholderiales bacterium]|jgi:uncharacterized protein (DUF934 family)|nr:DUF934 domain-containing protein [Burkholderiales bacterium]
MATLIRNRQIAANPPSHSILRLEPDQDVAAVADRLVHVERVEVHFPKFGDGRGFSIAKLLRERYGYKGELRAVGHVVRDHLGPMEAVGFDSFLLKEDEDAEIALGAFSDFPIFAPAKLHR